MEDFKDFDISKLEVANELYKQLIKDGGLCRQTAQQISLSCEGFAISSISMIPERPTQAFYKPALEGVLGSIWDSIINFFKWIIDTVKGWWKKGKEKSNPYAAATEAMKAKAKEAEEYVKHAEEFVKNSQSFVDSALKKMDEFEKMSDTIQSRINSSSKDASEDDKAFHERSKKALLKYHIDIDKDSTGDVIKKLSKEKVLDAQTLSYLAFLKESQNKILNFPREKVNGIVLKIEEYTEPLINQMEKAISEKYADEATSYHKEVVANFKNVTKNGNIESLLANESIEEQIKQIQPLQKEIVNAATEIMKNHKETVKIIDSIVKAESSPEKVDLTTFNKRHATYIDRLSKLVYGNEIVKSINSANEINKELESLFDLRELEELQRSFGMLKNKTEDKKRLQVITNMIKYIHIVVSIRNHTEKAFVDATRQSALKYGEFIVYLSQIQETLVVQEALEVIERKLSLVNQVNQS